VGDLVAILARRRQYSPHGDLAAKDLGSRLRGGMRISRVDVAEVDGFALLAHQLRSRPRRRRSSFGETTFEDYVARCSELSLLHEGLLEQPSAPILLVMGERTDAADHCRSARPRVRLTVG